MTVGFMSVFAIILGERVEEEVGEFLLAPMIVIGLFSCVYWHWTDDLRLYILVQFVPLIAIPVLTYISPAKYSETHWQLIALGFYALAKMTEAFDKQIFSFTSETISGHTLKHLAASAVPVCLAHMVLVRQHL